MASPTLGHKHVCSHCSTRFYDMGAAQIPCPKCGTPLNLPQAGAPVLITRDVEPAKTEKDGRCSLPVVESETPLGSSGAIEAFEHMDEDEASDIECLSELEDREPGRPQHTDDVEEDALMEDLQNHDIILDHADDSAEEPHRADSRH